MDGGQTLVIEYRALGSLIPYARHARTHSAAQVALIAGSIREFGFTNPVLADGASGILARRGQVMAAKKWGWRSTVRQTRRSCMRGCLERLLPLNMQSSETDLTAKTL